MEERKTGYADGGVSSKGVCINGWLRADGENRYTGMIGVYGDIHSFSLKGPHYLGATEGRDYSNISLELEGGDIELSPSAMKGMLDVILPEVYMTAPGSKRSFELEVQTTSEVAELIQSLQAKLKV